MSRDAVEGPRYRGYSPCSIVTIADGPSRTRIGDRRQGVGQVVRIAEVVGGGARCLAAACRAPEGS